MFTCLKKTCPKKLIFSQIKRSYLADDSKLDFKSILSKRVEADSYEYVSLQSEAFFCQLKFDFKLNFKKTLFKKKTKLTIYGLQQKLHNE